MSHLQVEPLSHSCARLTFFVWRSDRFVALPRSSEGQLGRPINVGRLKSFFPLMTAVFLLFVSAYWHNLQGFMMHFNCNYFHTCWVGGRLLSMANKERFLIRESDTLGLSIEIQSEVQLSHQLPASAAPSWNASPEWTNLKCRRLVPRVLWQG